MHTSIPPKKSLGQHFLTNPRVVETMLDAAQITAGDVVLEIGPGTGVLTKGLLQRGAVVHAVEIDQRSVATLKETFGDEIAKKQLFVHVEDARTIDLASIGLSHQQYKIVANIPYYISGQLFRRFLEHNIQPSCIVFLVQKEVAKRVARGEKESLLSLGVKAFGAPRYITTVPKGNFNPPPKVDSAVIAISDISRKRFKHQNMAFFFDILHLGFGSKRKQLLGNLSKKFNRDALIHIFSTLKIPPTIRAEDLPLELWLKLSFALEKQSK